jgi:hypothetical protein
VSAAEVSLPALDEAIDGRVVLTVPEAGALLGMSRPAAYRAAEVGQIPTLRLGRRLVVPVPKLLTMLGVSVAPVLSAPKAASVAHLEARRAVG